MKQSWEQYAYKSQNGVQRFHSMLGEWINLLKNMYMAMEAEDNVFSEALKHFADGASEDMGIKNPFDGYADMEDLRKLCLDIMLDNNMSYPPNKNQYTRHPFRGEAKRHIREHPLARYNCNTRAQVYSVTLHMRYTGPRLRKVIRQAYLSIPGMEGKEAATRCDWLVNLYLLGVAEHLRKSLLYTDQVSDKPIWKIIMEEKLDALPWPIVYPHPKI